MKKVLLTTVLSLMMCMGVYAQDYMNPPKANEKVIGSVSVPYTEVRADYTKAALQQVFYNKLLEIAKANYTNKVIDIRGMDLQFVRTSSSGNYNYYVANGKVVDLHDPEAQIYGNLSQALNKALHNVREGSRLAIDQVTVISGMDRETLKDQLLDVLLEKGYRVVAKDYLEKLYDEIKDQGSGIYNDKTTVQEDNFSAAGYYINVKVTETSLRVQVVNVSTGEYEGNATVNF